MKNQPNNITTTIAKNTFELNIDDFTKCYICLGRIQDATMCPNCQKFCCQRCIQVTKL